MSLGRVLVVDDDRPLAAMIGEELARAGFECVHAVSDRAAQNALSAGRPFDILVTDVNLGEGVTGFDLARAARQRLPGIRVIYISGEANAQQWMAFGVPASDYISKPFTLEKLKALLLQAMSNPPPGATQPGATESGATEKERL